MTPNHAIFRLVFAEGLKVTDRTFDYLPDTGTQYPFIYVGESSNANETNFDLFGNATQTIHIYATRRQRAELDNLTSLLLNLYLVISRMHQITQMSNLSFTGCWISHFFITKETFNDY